MLKSGTFNKGECAVSWMIADQALHDCPTFDSCLRNLDNSLIV